MEPSIVDRAVSALLEETAAQTGTEYLLALSRATCHVLGVEHAFVGRVDDPERPSTVRSLAYWRGEGPGEPFEYSLADTPCEGVIGVGACTYRAGVQAQFPKDALLADMGIVGYAGIPIRSRAGVVGLLVALHDAPLTHDPQIEQALRLFAARAGAELERLDFEQRLAASEARYRQIVTSIHEGVWAIDTDARTTFVNPRMTAMLGCREEEMLGRSMYDFMDEQAREDAERNEARRKSGIAEHHPFRLRRKDGTELWVTMAASPLPGPDGTYVGALAVVTDLTESKRLDERVQQAQKLESLGALSAGIAHDFNNLLMAVLGNLDLATVEGDLPGAVGGYLEQAQAAALRAASLTQQLLAYAGRGAQKRAIFSLRKVLEETSQLVATSVPKAARLVVDEPEPGLAIEGDEAQVVQILLNLVINASEALVDGRGTISVTCRGLARPPADATALLLGPLAPVPHVELRVADDGAGMDAATRARLFDPFFTTKTTGRGLGLAGVAGIVRRHRGAVQVESAPGKGTVMSVYLPAAAHRPRLSTPPAATRPPRGSGTVLIVDDENAVRRAVRRMLEFSGYDVDECADGLAGLSQITEQPSRYAFVVLDVAMPGLDGNEVLRRVRAAGIEVPIVVVSGHSGYLAGHAEEPRTRFVAKPFTAQALLTAAQEARG